MQHVKRELLFMLIVVCFQINLNIIKFKYLILIIKKYFFNQLNFLHTSVMIKYKIKSIIDVKNCNFISANSSSQIHGKMATQCYSQCNSPFL